MSTPDPAAAREAIATRAQHAIDTLRGRLGDNTKEAVRLLVDARLRTTRPEILDLPSTPVGVKRRMIEDVDRLNRMLRIYQHITKRLAPMIEMARVMRRGRPVRIVDVGCGSGGLVFELGRWAERKRIGVELLGVDADAGYIDDARRRAWELGVRADFQVMDGRALDLRAGGVDVAVTQFVLHHLVPADVALMLSELDRVAAVNWLAIDTRRSLPMLPALWALLKLTVDAPAVHDGIVSLRKGYTAEEVRVLVEAAGLSDIAVQDERPAHWTAQRRTSLSGA
jgi:SAM-dependent methyltransferase